MKENEISSSQLKLSSMEQGASTRCTISGSGDGEEEKYELDVYKLDTDWISLTTLISSCYPVCVYTACALVGARENGDDDDVWVARVYVRVRVTRRCCPCVCVCYSSIR